MLETQKESLNINKLIAEKKEVIFAESDMIVPDAKPDILSTISTSGVVAIYKKDVQQEKVRIDGTVNTYIMYMPDGTEDTVRGLNTNVDFSQNIEVPNCKEGMNVITNISVKSIETQVINGRKIAIKAMLDVDLKVYSNENVEIVNSIPNSNSQENDNIQVLKQDLTINSLVGSGTTKVYAKDNIQIDNNDLLAEILQTQINVTDKDIKISYNKVLTKAEAQIKMMYLTEDNRINVVKYSIPVVGFVDIQNVAEGNICDVNYEIKNIIIKPNTQDEHSIYVEIEIEVTCFSYEEKQINLIQDMYSPTQKLNFERKQITTITNKQNISDTKQISKQVSLENIDGLSLLNVETKAVITNENKINTKIMYESELNMKFVFENSQKQIITRDAQIPFNYTLENIQNGENLNSNCEMLVKSQDFTVQGNVITSNIEIQINTSLYEMANLNVIDNVEEDGKKDEPDYSLVIYVVTNGDSLWNIAKKFGSTVEVISKTSGIEDEKITKGQKLYIPRFDRIANYE